MKKAIKGEKLQLTKETLRNVSVKTGVKTGIYNLSYSCLGTISCYTCIGQGNCI